eukprot:COSAG02_NODE_1173_length_14105_cov_15.197701_7_plen_166_part_00
MSRGVSEDRTSRVARQRENDQERDHRVHCLLRSALAQAWRATSHRTSTRSLHTTRVCTAHFCIICHTLSASDGPPGRGEAPMVRRLAILVLARAHFLLDAMLLSLDRSPGCARVCSRDLRPRPRMYTHMGARRRCSRPAHHRSTGTPVYPSIIAIIWRLRAATDG